MACGLPSLLPRFGAALDFCEVQPDVLTDAMRAVVAEDPAARRRGRSGAADLRLGYDGLTGLVTYPGFVGKQGTRDNRTAERAHLPSMRNFIRDLVIDSQQFKGTARALRWDMIRLGARLRSRRMLRRLMERGPLSTKLHLGSGSRKVQGWLNCDVIQADVDVDLACGTLPFPTAHFEAVVAQHVIEHLDLEEELQPLLRDLHRCLKPGGEIWLSCPDMQKVCEGYVADRGQGLVLDRQTRWPKYTTRGYHVSHVVNDLFHQGGQHKNIFDFDLLAGVVSKAGFREITQEQESSLLARYPEFPPRRDDLHSLVVRAVKP